MAGLCGMYQIIAKSWPFAHHINPASSLASQVYMLGRGHTFSHSAGDGHSGGASAACAGRPPPLVPSSSAGAAAFSAATLHLDPGAHAASPLRHCLLPNFTSPVITTHLDIAQVCMVVNYIS